MGLPRFPEPAIQEQYNGRSGRAALEAAWPFFEKLNATVPVNGDTRVLDFGVGWGRIARLFDGLTEKVLMADISQQAIDLAKRCGVRGELIKIEQGGPLPIDLGSVDLAYAHSVFSHISEESARHWLSEISRVLKKGGVFVLTTHSLGFLHLVRACRNKPDANEIEQQIGRYFANPDAAVIDFELNRYVFSGTGGGIHLTADDYGWAAIPRSWIAIETARYFTLDEYTVSPDVLKQSIVVLRRI